MARMGSYFTSTIGRKQLLGISGIGLSFFVLSHAVGNLLLFVGPEAYNLYSHALISNPLIYLLEMGLLGVFMLHIINAFCVTLVSQKARVEKYAMLSSGPKATPPLTRAMWYQGICILVFVAFHIYTMKFGTIYEITYDGQVVRDLYRLVIETFQQPNYMVGYSLAVFILALHMSHGVSSSIQTLGFHHPRHTKNIKRLGVIFSIFIGAGFLVQPIYFYFFYKG